MFLLPKFVVVKLALALQFDATLLRFNFPLFYVQVVISTLLEFERLSRHQYWIFVPRQSMAPVQLLVRSQ